MLNGFLALVVTASATLAGPQAPEHRWFKGNLHTHSWFSDGDSPPEMVAAWYKENGYDFLAMTDHNTINHRGRWVPMNRFGRERSVAAYEANYSPEWIEKEMREVDGEQVPFYRLKTLDEVRTLYAEAGRFLLIRGSEISDAYRPQEGGAKPVHLGAINLKADLQPTGGTDVPSTIANNIAAVHAHEAEYSVPMLIFVAHPNFQHAITPEDMIKADNATHFEVYNGHPSVLNYGDDQSVSTERLWDIVLTHRLTVGNGLLLYGVATDDMHNLTLDGRGSSPGRGWVMARARYLSTWHVIDAIKRGDFYASTGVTLTSVCFKDNALTVEIEPRDGANYTTQFIGTLKGAEGDDAIGAVLAEVSGTTARYEMTGRELYVRAKVISDVEHPNPFAPGDVEVAWTQPVVAAE